MNNQEKKQIWAKPEIQVLNIKKDTFCESASVSKTGHAREHSTGSNKRVE